MKEKDAHKMSNASLSQSTNTSINKELNKSKKTHDHVIKQNFVNVKDAHKMSNASLSRSTNTSINKELNKSKKHINKKAKNDATKIIH